MWEDREDDLTPEIKADFGSPGFFKRSDRARELVGNRHSKHALVALVAYLLQDHETEGLNNGSN